MKAVQRAYAGHKSITVGGGNADIAGFDSNAMQLAADALKGRGGVIRLSAGVFEIFGPVRLHDNIHLCGAGRATKLVKSPYAASAFAVDVDYGVHEAVVTDPSGFRAGTGIRIEDAAHSGGWAVSTSKIVSVEGDTLHFDRRTVMDYARDNGGIVTNICSMIEAVKAEGVRISDLSLDGAGTGKARADGCRVGAVYLHKAAECTVENVLVERFDGDGVSWQITEDVAVKNCVVKGCAGFGLHPGTGTLRTAVEDCLISDNGEDGLFVCWRVQHGAFRNNTFDGNGWSGISIGHRDTDNLFEGNRIRGNGRSGVTVRGETDCNRADRNVYRRNTIEDNGNDTEGCGFLYEGETDGNVIEGNVIRDTGGGRQRAGIACRGGGLERLTLANNTMSGHGMGDSITI